MKEKIERLFTNKVLYILISVSLVLFCISIIININSLLYEENASQALSFPTVLLHLLIFPLFFPFVYLNSLNKKGILKVLFFHKYILIKALLVITYVYFVVIMLIYMNDKINIINIGIIGKYIKSEIGILTFFSATWSFFYIIIPNGLLSIIAQRKA